MVKSVEKTFNILEYLAECGHPLALGEISDGLENNKSTVRRFLLTLKRLGYIDQDPETRLYQLTPKVAWLARKIPRDITLTSLATPFMDFLAHETGETINLGVLDDMEILYIDKRESAHRLRLCVEVGGKGPLHATALGKSIAAFLPENDKRTLFIKIGQLEKLTDNTITTWREFEIELEQVRKDGVAYDNEELIEGLYCVGAPVFMGNEVIAALSISTPVTRINSQRKEIFKSIVLDQSQKLSNELSISQPFIITV